MGFSRQEYWSRLPLLKKSEIISFAGTWINLVIAILSEISQKEKYKYYMKSLTCGIEKNDTIELYKTETKSHKLIIFYIY